ncbi:MAG: transglutaminase-like domain-containing protein [Bacteroidia bacterium]
MLDSKEIQALISLLDDTDEEVVNHVEERILALGTPVIPALEVLWHTQASHALQQRIETLIHQLQYTETLQNLKSWAKDGAKDLFEGAFLVAKFRYPGLDRQDLSNKIDQLKLDAWLELHNDLSSLEKVRVLNYIFYQVHGFKGNTENYHSPDNSFINRVLETKKGNPISLAIIYSVIAQRLNIPIFGVNLPQHFILAYRDDTKIRTQSAYNAGKNYLHHQAGGNVLFYINAFNKGLVFSKWNIDQFLKQLQVEPEDFYYEPCGNVDIILRIIRNLIFSYEKLKNPSKSRDMQALLEHLQPYSSLIL